MKPKISVIVPVYNGEKHLRDCMDSLLKQTLRDIEILTVDNGSSDNSGAILAGYADKDKRVKVLTLNPNRGPSGARNAALDIAEGEYIAFCDCDDQVPEDAYETVCKSLLKKQADIVVGNYIEVADDGTEILHSECEGEKEDYNCYLKSRALWDKVFRRRLIADRNIRFSLSTKYGEDTLFLAEILNLDPSISRITQVIYKYYRHADKNTSLTKHFTADHIKQDLDGKIRYYSLLNSEKYPRLADSPIYTARNMYRIWKRITDPEEKKAGFYYLQKFVAAHYMKDRRLFFGCFCVAPEVFSTISFENYMKLLDKSTAGYPFRFSVIVPIYNTETYLEETIKSVVEQSVDFRENVQMVLVNNATEDNSEEICKRYRALYPDNIVYVKLEENAGPAGAREAGKQYATGKYINFLDSDDKWGNTAFIKAWIFLEAHPEVDFAACRVRHFDAKNNWHALDYKFRNTGVADIRENCDYVQLNLCSCFIRSETVKKYQFETDLHHAEDAQYLSQIVLEKCKYGIIKDAVFYYRTRRDKSSTLQNVATSREWYFATPVRVYQWAIEEAKHRQPAARAYVQNLVAYELQWRLFKKLPKDLSLAERETYCELLRSLLQKIDDGIIWGLRNLTNRQKVTVLYFKHGETFRDHIQLFDGTLYCDGIDFKNFDSQDFLRIEIMDLSGKELTLHGRVLLPFQKASCRFCLFDREGNEHPIELHKAVTDDFVVMQDCMQKYNFSVHIELQKETDLWFSAITDDGIYPVKFSNGRRFPLTHSLSHSHCRRGSWHFHLENNKIIVRKRSFFFDLKKQFGLWVELFKKKKRTSLLCHIFIYFLSFFPKQKEIWIFSDRASFAGDNGECFFKYVNKVKNKKIKTYFSIRSDSPDYRRLKKYHKNIVANNSKKFKFLYLRADKIVSSHFDDANWAPLGIHEEFLKDLIHSKQIYLQHGVIKDDLTRDNEKLFRNVSGFVTSGEKERQSLLSLPYGYLKNEVWLTGLARYDNIYDCVGEHGKVIMIAPTWRDYFTFENWSHEDGLLEECPEFLETDYFKFYNALLNDEELLDVMRHNGYKGIFRPHPVMMHFSHYFEENDVFSVEMRSQSYREEIRATALFITDYSSTVFDYAYVYRPCVYAQFDKEKFISGHSYKPGYFDYERDGFGPVCYDYESTVRTIIKTIENGCVMEEKYYKRAEEFFAYRDGKNCERIYQKILRLDGER